MDPTARVSDQVRPSSPSPEMNSSEADPHPAPPAAAAQSAEPGSQGSIPSPQKPNPTIPTPPPRNASVATATAESSRNAPEPTTAPSLKAPGVTTAAPCRKSSRAASTTTAATAKPSRNTPGPTTATTAPSLKALGVTTAAPSRKASGATSTTAAACLRNPSGATTSAAAVSRIPSAPATTTTNAISGYPSVATAAVAAQNPLGTAAVGSVPRGTAPTRPEDYTPQMGMEFESEQEAYEFYRYYGWMVGFNVRKEYGNRSKKTGEITSRRFSCSREGHRAGAKAASNKRLPMPDSRTGCHAHLIIRRRKQDSKLEVYVFEPRHNHPLFDPSSMPCPFRGTAMPNGVPTPDYLANVGEPSGVQNSTEGGNAVSTRGAPRQPLRTRRQREMRFGEAGALLNYFQERCLAEPSFYHAVQLDADDKMTNTFWADGRMIVDYAEFGDVVAFDMVSRSGTSIRHFASFVGVNNFGEPIIFALALMYDETAESFQWLFETFLHAMSRQSGQSPKTFFSHQDTVITKAVSLVMPKTSHVICAWNLKHAGKRILNLLGKDEGDFFKEFKACINEYEEEIEFLTSWNAMINKHNLQDNVWLQQVFEEKEKWARPYVKGTFSAGMKGTQLNEQFHSDVRDHLKAEVDVISFLNNLQKVINDRRYKEMEVEYSSRLKLPFFKIKAPILAQASEAYTSTIFQLFQEEYEEFQSAYIVNRDESGPCREYTVSIVEKEKQYTVCGNPMEQTVSCSCRKFEARGFLCSHALKVLDAMDIKYLPDRYIMKRWTKYAKRLTSSVVPDQTFQADDSMEFSSCYQHMCKKYVRLVARASECVETYRVLDKFWFELGKKVDDILQKQTSIDASMIQPDVQDLMTSLSSITNGAGQENLREKSSKARTKESKKGQKNKIQPRNCIEKGLRKKQKIHAEQSSMPYPLSNASGQPGNALFQGIDLSNPTGPINYEGMHSGLHLSFTPELGFDLSHLSDK